MKAKIALFLSVILSEDLLFANSCIPPKFKVIDLSHTLDSKSIKWPMAADFTLTVLSRGWTSNQKYWFEANKMETPEHIGTHLDAPSHFSDSGWRVHNIPADRLVGPGVVVDVRSKVNDDPDYRLQISDLENWEQLHGSIPIGAFVFMWSGWDIKYSQKTLTFNSETPDDPTSFHFPGFHPEAVEWLVKNRNIGMIGVDTPSTDYGQSREFEVHQILSKASVMGLENVNNLGNLPASGSIIVAAPIKLTDGSGVPIRLLGLLDRDSQSLCESDFRDQSCHVL